MHPKLVFKLLWLVPALLAMLIHFAVIPAQGEQPLVNCAEQLGQVQHKLGAPLSANLEVLSWNIQKASNDGWEQDLATFGSGVDLAFIQEASLQALIPAAIGTELHPVFAPGYSSAGRDTGVMTLSAGQPASDCKLTAMEPWLRTPKATSIAEYPLIGRDERLLTINVHSVNFDLGMASFQSQLEVLRKVLIQHQGPVIFAGDFNTWSTTRQTAVDTFMAEHGLDSISFEPDLRTRAFGRALDHIYVRGMHAEYAQVIPVTTSDHNPLRVRLAIQ